MLDPKQYNIEALKAFSKQRFYDTYKGVMFDIDKVWAWLHPEKEATEEKPKGKKKSQED